MKNFDEELDEINELKDLNLARQKRFEILMTSLRGKNSLLKNSKLWDQSRVNTLNLHFFHCQNINPILEVRSNSSFFVTRQHECFFLL